MQRNSVYCRVTFTCRIADTHLLYQINQRLIAEAVDAVNQTVEMPLVFDGGVQLCESLRVI